ncbi:hypothetical protein VP01_3782g1 [Puccinia sorghi]|uniref:Uncharacterized protein n=1 Tax=Puccinia sorghi TaxID=27349 RepID=A0A0L6UUF5_9BASI|nr:hypothetical protein VP01_3782g1 [Puccinia sorghi]
MIESPTNFVKTPDCDEEIQKDKKQAIVLTWEIHVEWEKCIQNDKHQGEHNLIQLQSISLNNGWYTPEKTKKSSRNSHIEYCKNRYHFFGKIKEIFKLKGEEEEAWLTVFPFKNLDRHEETKNPYINLKRLNCQLLLCDLGPEEVIQKVIIIGNVALMLGGVM